MNEWVQYGALGILGIVTVGGAVFARSVIAPLATKMIETLPQVMPITTKMEEHLSAIRGALGRMGERNETTARFVGEIASSAHDTERDVHDLHNYVFGTSPGKRKPKLVPVGEDGGEQ